MHIVYHKCVSLLKESELVVKLKVIYTIYWYFVEQVNKRVVPISLLTYPYHMLLFTKWFKATGLVKLHFYKSYMRRLEGKAQGR